jgi:hypothetical protein
MAVMKAKVLSCLLVGFAVLLLTGTANAQDDPPFECDDDYGECGTPQQSGGGGGGGGGSILINNTDLGDTYQYADDYDDDGVEDPYDNCPFVSNPSQADDDGDDIGTGCDNCPNAFNPDQADIDGDQLGNACDGDMDGDAVDNGDDICPQNPDPLQKDTDNDGLGDACDDDMDGDGVTNLEDNCPLVPNPDQSDDDPGIWGDACDDDDDGDGIRNTYDNCPQVANYDQEDADGDGMGDACDSDMDGDGVLNYADNCPVVQNADQVDSDRDKLGDQCDDYFCYVVLDDVDNCLDPEGPFAVYSPTATAETGEELRLRLFANRINQPLRYTWKVVGAPSGSNATIDNPQGAASISTPFEYHYLKDRPVQFVPDKPGTYEVYVTATLVWEDEVTGEVGATAETTTTIEVYGEALDTLGCSTAPIGRDRSALGGGLLAFLMLAAGLALLRRR